MFGVVILWILGSLRAHPGCRIHFRRPVHFTVFDEDVNMANIADVFRRVSVDKDHVGVLAGSNRSEVLLFVHDRRGFDGCNAKNFRSWNSRLVINLEFAVKRIPTTCVGPSHDLHAAVV